MSFRWVFSKTSKRMRMGQFTPVKKFPKGIALYKKVSTGGQPWTHSYLASTWWFLLQHHHIHALPGKSAIKHPKEGSYRVCDKSQAEKNDLENLRSSLIPKILPGLCIGLVTVEGRKPALSWLCASSSSFSVLQIAVLCHFVLVVRSLKVLCGEMFQCNDSMKHGSHPRNGILISWEVLGASPNKWSYAQ